MPIRFYLVPIDEVTNAGTAYRVPKYFTVSSHDPRGGAQLLTVPFEFKDFGLEPTGLIAANVTAGEHTTIAAQSDVTSVPTNLDNTLGGQLATVQAALESLHIPADALVAGATYRQVLRGVIAVFSVAQRFNGVANGRLFPSGVTLSTTLGDLSANVRGQLKTAAEALGYNYSSLTLTSTLRDVLKALANQSAPSSMLGVSI